MSAKVLQWVVMTSVPGSDCLRTQSNINTETQICAGDPGRDSCFGDSGGPLLAKTETDEVVQTGIVSFGSVRCGDGTPGIYTKVSAFTSWIESNLRP